MENPEDDPRQFSGAGGEFDDPFSGDGILCESFLSLCLPIASQPQYSGAPEYNPCNGTSIAIATSAKIATYRESSSATGEYYLYAQLLSGP